MATIVFDFDGTLTKKSYHIWRKIWEELGYDTSNDSYYKSLYKKFLNNEITRLKWCELTCEAYRQKGFTKKQMQKLAKSIKLKPEVKKLIKNFSKQGHELYLVSGNINQVVAIALKDTQKYFKTINANSFIFDDNEIIKKIEVTKYDFDGKAKFVDELITKQNIDKNDIYFVGNGRNDEWVYQTGCHTICVLPNKDTPQKDKGIWHHSITNLKELNKIIN